MGSEGGEGREGGREGKGHLMFCHKRDGTSHMSHFWAGDEDLYFESWHLFVKASGLKTELQTLKNHPQSFYKS